MVSTEEQQADEFLKVASLNMNHYSSQELTECNAVAGNYLVSITNESTKASLVQLIISITKKISLIINQKDNEIQQKDNEIGLIQSKNEQDFEIFDGKCFASLEEVWSFKQAELVEEITLFDRPPSVIDELDSNGINYYKITTNVENMEDMEAVDEQSLSRSESSTTSTTNKGWDIFGNQNDAPIAHLMPASGNQAMKWHHIVPGVLSSDARNSDCMNMFINGFRRIGFRSAQGVKKRHKRENFSGIKHFPTNKIRLNDNLNFDKIRGLLIVPILTVEEIKKWNGGGYDAIVLAAGKSENIYKNIGATFNLRNQLHQEFFAQPDQIEKCCVVLGQLIQVVTRSHVEAKKKLSESKSEESTLEEESKVLVLVPELVRHDEKSCTGIEGIHPAPGPMSRVRKIHFCDVGKSSAGNEGVHQAPDPMLLLSKAVSNWLHIRKEKEILPSVESDTTSETTSMSTYDSKDENNLILYNLPPWDSNSPPATQRPEYLDNPPITEISCINDGELSVSISSD